MTRESQSHGPHEDGVKPTDAHRLAEWFTNHREHLRRMVGFRLDDRLAQRIDPSDVLQEAFINARMRMREADEKFAGASLLWLRQITEQTLIDLHRRHLGAKKRSAGREVSLAAKGVGETTSLSLAAVLASGDSSPSHAAIRQERRDRLNDALDQMDAVDREILALRHGEELSNVEAAELLGLSPTAASNRYIRALKRLKPLLKPLES